MQQPIIVLPGNKDLQQTLRVCSRIWAFVAYLWYKGSFRELGTIYFDNEYAFKN